MMRLTAVKRALTSWGWSGIGGLMHPSKAMAVDQDWAEIDNLLTAEQWPFVRGDFEMSAAQPTHSAHVVRRDQELAGFFVAHGFGDVGYLDMMIVGSRWRGKRVARPLYVAVMKDLSHTTGIVVHTTNDSASSRRGDSFTALGSSPDGCVERSAERAKRQSEEAGCGEPGPQAQRGRVSPNAARIIRLLGFQPGATYTLLARDPQPGEPKSAQTPLEPVDVERAVMLDALTFGVARPSWTATWINRAEVDTVGLISDGELRAFVALRPRREGAFGLDLLSCSDEAHLQPLIDRVLQTHGHRRLECFVRDGSPLQAVLKERGFLVPDFFRDIGPLIEWRRADTSGVGDGPGVHTLLWL